MKKFLTAIFLSLFIFAVSALPSPTLAQDPNAVQPVDINALFWPVVPGKTVADPMFFLKQIKESFDGMFKSGNIGKAEYQIGLSEKRLVEAAKLVENKDFNNALKSLGMNKSNRDEAVRLRQKAKEENQDATELAVKLVKSLENQQKALAYLKNQFPADQQQQIQTMVDNLTLQISEAK